SPSRNANRELRLRARLGNQLKPQSLQDRDNRMRFNAAAQNALDLRCSQHYRGLVDLTCNRVDGNAVECASSGVGDSLRYERAGERRHAVIRAELETVRRIGVQAVSLCGPANCSRIKPR